MNKLKLWLLIPGIIAISASSCKKDESDSPETTAPIAEGSAIIAGSKSCVLTKFSYDGGDYETIEYDSKNRPVKVNFFDSGKAEGYSKITYTATDVMVEYYDDKNVKEDTYNYKLGSNGYIASSSHIDSYQSGGFTQTTNSSSVNTYNSEGYLTKEEYTNVRTSTQPGYVSTTDKSATTYTYTNGNLTTISYTGGGSTGTSTYEYDADKTNNLPFSDDEVLTFLLGKRSKNLLKKETNAFSGGSDVSTFSYTFNTDGLITKQTETSVYKTTGFPDQTSTDNYMFDYSCK